MILYLNYKKNKKTVLSIIIFRNVCKHYLIIYGCLKFTFKKLGRIKKKLKFLKKNLKKKIVKTKN
jgi:hypothetical protein